MIVFSYDKSFEGLLSVVFDAYNRKIFPDKLLGEGDLQPLFTESHFQVITSSEKSERVWAGLQKKLPRKICDMLICLWLSEEKGSDELLFRYIRKVFDSPERIFTDFADDDMLQVKKIAEKVAKERLYLIQFIRFQKTSDDTYVAFVSPKYNALPLTLGYLTDRFGGQKWLVYDLRRKYGYYYDLEKVIEITLTKDDDLSDGRLNKEMMAEDEQLFQELWKNYFKALTIKERLNPRLHTRNMPRRFWKYMTEKQ